MVHWWGFLGPANPHDCWIGRASPRDDNFTANLAALLPLRPTLIGRTRIAGFLFAKGDDENFRTRREWREEMGGRKSARHAGVAAVESQPLPSIAFASSRRYLVRGWYQRRQLLLDDLAQGAVFDRATQEVTVDEKTGRTG